MSFRRGIPEIVNQHQLEALGATMCILQTFGPTGFLLQEENQVKKAKVFIGENHSCSCKSFAKEKDLCKHICWVLLKKFKLDKYDPLSWQFGINEREIENILRNSASKADINKVDVETAEHSMDQNLEGIIQQRQVGTNDICPVCQDEFLNSKRLLVTFCRKGCGKSVHMRCMKMWKEHQTKKSNPDLADYVSCPMCRGRFGTFGELIQEFAYEREINSKKIKKCDSNDNLSASIARQFELSIKHMDSTCAKCGVSPIFGRIFKQVSRDELFCAKCIRDSCGDSDSLDGSNQKETDLIWKDKCTDKWAKMPSDGGLLVGIEPPRTTGEGNDKRKVDDMHPWASMPALSRAELSRLTKWTLKPSRVSISNSRARGANDLLAMGRQCQACLMHYQEGDEVRKLPGCGHIFHTACINPWLLHASPCCPLDHIYASPPLASFKDTAGRKASFEDAVAANKFPDDLFKITGSTFEKNSFKVSKEALKNRTASAHFRRKETPTMSQTGSHLPSLFVEGLLVGAPQALRRRLAEGERIRHDFSRTGSGMPLTRGSSSVNFLPDKKALESSLMQIGGQTLHPHIYSSSFSSPSNISGIQRGHLSSKYLRKI